MIDTRLVLTSSPRRAGLTAFGITLGLWVAVTLGVVMPLAPPLRIGIALVAGIVVGGVLVARHGTTARLYRLWGRASRLYAKITRTALLVICHAVITVAGLAGTSLTLRRPSPDASLWHRRETLAPQAYASQFDMVGRNWTGRPWRALVDWALRSGNWWVLFLLPFLILLATLDTDEQGRYPAGIYTLF